MEPFPGENYFTETISQNFGYVHTYQQLDNLIRELEIHLGIHFLLQNALHCQTELGPLDIVDEIRKRRVVWNEDAKAATPHIPYDGVPFIVLAKSVRECEFGKDWKWKKKGHSRPKTQEEHNYASVESRLLTQPSKKQNCTALIRIKEIARFPTFQITENSAKAKRKQRQCLKASKDISFEKRIYIKLPDIEAHNGHLLAKSSQKMSFQGEKNYQAAEVKMELPAPGAEVVTLICLQGYSGLCNST